MNPKLSGFLKEMDRHQHKGLLVLRIGIGVMFMIHGFPKISGGVETWTGLGGVLGDLGFNIAPTFMGFMAALSEFGGGFLLVLGLFTRLASFFLLITMLVASTMHMSNGDSFGTYSHAMESAILFFSLVLIGPGKLSLDYRLFSKSEDPDVPCKK